MGLENNPYCQCRHRAHDHSGHVFAQPYAGGGALERRGCGPCHVAGCSCPEYQFRRTGQKDEEVMEHGG
jgi:hypothetical protein